jgi:putative transposase
MTMSDPTTAAPTAALDVTPTGAPTGTPEEPDYGLRPEYLLPDELWEQVKALLPPPKPKKKAGRPRVSDRQCLTAIFYLLRTGCQWNALPRSLGASSTVHDRFQEWRDAGVFERLWAVALAYYDDRQGLDLEWQAADGAMTKAPLGGKRDRS